MTTYDAKDGVLIDDRVRRLIVQIDQDPSLDHLNELLKELIQTLDHNCQNPAIRKRYQDFHKIPLLPLESLKTVSPYPLDEDGYAIAFDPFEDEQAFWQCWLDYGFVVGKSVISRDVCQETIHRIFDILHQLSQGHLDINRPETYHAIPVDDHHISCLSRGFFEVYHDRSLAQLRQAIRLYLHHVIIWGQVELWTSFDRFGLKLPGHEESKGLPLHVDQNPLVQPQFETIQGVLALTDCPIDRGTFRAVPRSRDVFPEYAHFVKAKGADYRGEYVETMIDSPITKTLYSCAQAIPIRAGDIISWDSRTTHANTPNLSNTARIVAYIAAGPAREKDPEALKNRKMAFTTGIGSNVRSALMHASMPPRYSHPECLQQIRLPEQLTYLGKRLYGQERYATSL